MPIEPEQVELHTRNNMVHETPYDSSIRERTEEEDDDLGLSEGENKDSPEMIRECTPHSSSAVPSRAVLVLTLVNHSSPHAHIRLLAH